MYAYLRSSEGSAMTGCNTVTIILEFNRHARQSESLLGSVWLYNGDGRAGWEDERTLAELPGFLKVVGPIDYEIASQIHGALKTFFEQSGATVLDKGIAD
jgi:hypothetical protein